MLRVGPVGIALGLTLDVIYIACVAFHTFYDRAAFYPAWRMLLPGLALTWGTFLLGIVQVFVYGVLMGIIFVPIYNWLTRQY